MDSFKVTLGWPAFIQFFIKIPQLEIFRLPASGNKDCSMVVEKLIILEF